MRTRTTCLPYRKLLLQLSLVASLINTARPAELIQSEIKPELNGPGTNVMFGSAVALRGDALVVGAVLDDPGGEDSGSVYAFTRTVSGWSLQQRISAGDASPHDHFGRAVAMDGYTLVIGASEADTPAANFAGAAYVFVWNGSRWHQQAKLVAGEAGGDLGGSAFGTSVAISGDTIAVGAMNDKSSGTTTGAVYVFVRTGTTWSQQVKLRPSDGSAGAGLGYSVGLSGDTLVAGAPGVSPEFAGQPPSAYVFVRAGSGWQLQAKLKGRLEMTAFHSAFGAAVAIAGDTIVVGDKFDDGRNTDAGAATVYVRSGTTWAPQQALTASDAARGDLLGSAVAIDGDTIVVGSPWHTDSATGAGSAYVFARSGTTWTQSHKLTPNPAEGFANFGSSIAVSANRVIAGAPFKDASAGADLGAAYSFELNTLPTVTVDARNPYTSEAGGEFGLFRIYRSGDTSASLTVNFSIGGTAVNGSDYHRLENTVTIPGGVSFTDVTVQAFNDGEEESAEIVVLTLSSSAAYSLGPRTSATISIEDNDSPPRQPLQPTVSILASDPEASERGPDFGTFTISRSGDTSGPLTVYYLAPYGTAQNGRDYQLIADTTTIPAGSSSVDIMVQPSDDTELESPESVVLTLSASALYTVGSPNSASVIISDDDQPSPGRPMITVVAADPDASESGPDPGTFTISRSGDTSSPLTVFYAPLHGTARDGRDFNTLADSTIIPVGVSSVNLLVQPINDTELEGPESVVLTLAPSPAYVVGSPNTASITIADSHRPAPTFPALTRETKLGVEIPLPLAISEDTLAVGGHLFVRTQGAWTEQQSLSNGAVVAIERDTLVSGSNPVTVHVRSGTSWTAQQALPVSASSLAISGDTIAIGVEDDNARGVHAGAVLVYARNGTVWNQQAKITANDGVAGAALGYSVSLSGNTLVAGAPGRTLDFSGQTPAAYVFVRDGTTWSQQAKLTGNPDEIGPGQNFGLSVGIAANTIIVGDPNDDGRGQDAGAVFVFIRDGITWNRQQIITASDGNTGDFFGWSVAIKGDNLVAGAPRDSTDRGNQSGSAYVFGRDGTTWALLQKLTASDGVASSNFGTPLAIDEDTVAVGSFGGFFGSNAGARAVYVYEAAANTAPTVACPSPINFGCSPPGGLEATVSVQVGDAEGDGLTVSWSVDGSNAQTDSVPSSRPPRPAQLALRRIFALGTHKVRVTVSDGRESATCETVVTVGADTTPPVISCPADMVVAVEPGASSAVVNYRVLATDNCSSVNLVSNPRSGSEFPLGTTTVTSTATDAAGNQSTCSFRVTIQGHTPSGTFTLRAFPSVLWPPNGKMVPVTISVSAGTNFVASSFQIVSVKSNETVKSQGKGNQGNPPGRGRNGPPGRENDDDDRRQGPSRDDDDNDHDKKGRPKEDKDKDKDEDADWQITGRLTLKLRAERSGEGGGRVYTITVEGRDLAGNRVTKDVTVTVPHDQSPMRRHGHKIEGIDRSS
ncbi:MAG: HYR domain-containing protein [Verrucomicrobia bacterium]|nr:HYR domain-containing protein [Verrucomicrobiota bacterium]